MKLKKINIISIFFLLFFVFFPIKAQAKDLAYEAHIGKNGDNQQFMTFRKYVRHYGSSENTDWVKPDNKYLSSQEVTKKGSYVTQSMLFHKNYGTNYVWWEDGNEVLEVGYDKTNSKKIDTNEKFKDTSGNVLDFFKQYDITSDKTWIKLGQLSGNDIGMEAYLQTDLLVSKERIWNNIAITDFKATGDIYNNIIDKIEKNATKERRLL